METEKNPFDAMRGMMIDNLDKARGAMQNYVELLEKTMQGFPGANQEQIGTFRAYVQRQVAANHTFVDELLRAKDFQEALRIQVAYFQSQLKAVTEDATQIGAKIAQSFTRPKG
jgi:hypothetical protein